MLGVLVAPALTAAALTALLAGPGGLDRRRATVFLVAAETAVVVGALAQLSRDVGLDAADEGRAPTPLADAFGPLLLGAVVAAVALLDGVLHELRSRVLRLALALVLAIVGVPAVGMALVQPTTAVAGAAVLLVLVLRRRRRREAPMPS